MSVLVATDFSENSQSAVKSAAMLASTIGEPLRLMHVVDFAGDDNAWRVLYETADEIESHATSEATEQLKALYEAAIPEQYRSGYATVIRFGQPAEAIIAESDANRPSYIVAGTVGESRLQHLFFGRTTNHLVRETKIPVLAVPPSKDVHAFTRILVATDFSDCGDAAVIEARKMAQRFNAELHVMHAVDVLRPSLGALMGDIRPHVDSMVASQTERLNELEIPHTHVVVGRPDVAISNTVEKIGADLVIMGTHGRRGFARWFLGSTAERVLRQAKVPVLVVSVQA